MNLTVRPTVLTDVPSVKVIIDQNGLFPPTLIDEMIEPYFTSPSAEGEFWLTGSTEFPIGIAYCAPERMTSGTWNLLLIAISPSYQGKGYGADLMQAVEERLAKRGERILLVETSSLPEFERTRAFYRKLGYDQEARIREFYNSGEDKIVFRKALPLIS